VVFTQLALHGQYSSGCIECAKQPSLQMKAVERLYVIQNDRAHDPILPLAG